MLAQLSPTLHLQALERLCYTPLRPLRTSVKAEMALTGSYTGGPRIAMVVESLKRTVGRLTDLHILLTSSHASAPARRRTPSPPAASLTTLPPLTFILYSYLCKLVVLSHRYRRV